MNRVKLGELLLSKKIINQETLDKAIDLQKKTGEKFGRILVGLGVNENEILHLLANQLDLPFIDLWHYELDSSLVALLPETYARRYRALVLGRQDHNLIIGMVDPQDINAVDAISKLIKKTFKIAIVSEIALLSFFDRVYRHSHEISSFARELSEEILEGIAPEEKDDLFDEAQESDEQTPVVKLLNSLFRDAVQARASDIHIEPAEHCLRIRFRVDGVLSESVLDDKRILSALVQRLKLRAHLDIAEKRVPQDGRFNFKIKGKDFDVRLSTLPTANGEAVVMRLLNQSSHVNDLSQLGIDPVIVKRVESIYSKPHGMLLVTGPTGSGKTTTLYSVLQRLNVPERKIITVEDPVEYRIERVNQVQVNTKIDLTFARVLRAMLRQDPDVILVGEIRDTETAQIAMRAAITGHLVLATLHTNDALTSAMRLIDMGCEGYMVAAAIKGIIGQRLIRRLCTHCARVDKLDESEVAWVLALGISPDLPFKHAVGCSHCNFLGYHGRIGVYELLELNKEMLNSLRDNDSTRFVNAAVACGTYNPLSQSVLDLVKKGQTSIDEAIRIIGQLDDEFIRH